MISKLIEFCREEKERAKEAIIQLGSEDRYMFERDYYHIKGQYDVLDLMLEKALNGEFGDD